MMFFRDPYRPFRRRRAFAALALVLMAASFFATIAADWHEDTQDKECAACHVAHLPVVNPPVVALPDLPSVLDRVRILAGIANEATQPLISHAPRAPPA